MPSGELVMEREAEQLTVELSAAYAGLKSAIRHFEEAQTRVNEFLDRHEVIPPPRLGLPDHTHELYTLWMRTPDASELRQLVDQLK